MRTTKRKTIFKAIHATTESFEGYILLALRAPPRNYRKRLFITLLLKPPNAEDTQEAHSAATKTI